LQLDLRTDELSRHFRAKREPEKKKEDEEEDEGDEGEDEEEENEENEENEDKNEEDEDAEEIESMEKSYNEEADEDESEEEEENKDPKILITTHDMRIHLTTYKLCRELSRILPNADYFYRKNTRLTKIIPEAIKRDYSAMIVINEDRKMPSNCFYLFLTVISQRQCLFIIDTFYFRRNAYCFVARRTHFEFQTIEC
jgi:hypothetical protein